MSERFPKGDAAAIYYLRTWCGISIVDICRIVQRDASLVWKWSRISPESIFDGAKLEDSFSVPFLLEVMNSYPITDATARKLRMLVHYIREHSPP